MRDKITDYTAGNMVMTSWKWPVGAMEPGDAAGLCLSSPDSTENFWSCWTFSMDDESNFEDLPKSYLVDPATWTADSLLNTNEDITEGIFPAMYGGWMCFPPVEMGDNYYADCMRFLPSPEVSSPEDFLFEQGPINVMTYLTARPESDVEPLVDGNDTL